MSGRRSDEFAEGSDSADEQHAVFMVEDLLKADLLTSVLFFVVL